MSSISARTSRGVRGRGWRLSPSRLRTRDACRTFLRTAHLGVPNRDRQWSTPLAKQLGAAISMTGPVPLASYMRMCLTGDLGGYYTGAIGPGRDQFGLQGDFVTSPEISQVFGELIGIWFVTEWLGQGRQAKGVKLIELGPGRGTLMSDMLRTIQKFKDMAQSIDAIYMVEASPALRTAQKNLVCGTGAPMTRTEHGYGSVTKTGSIPIVWTELMKSIPNDPESMPLIVAHEFFDALPMHAFQCVDVSPSPAAATTTQMQTTANHTKQSGPQWRELLVSPTPPGSTHDSLHTPSSQSRATPPPDFQIALSKYPTHHSLYLPHTSPRYASVLAHSGPGAFIEVCPDASLHASAIAALIGNKPVLPRGAALILDYGPGDGAVPANSLRGIHRHARVSPFALAGQTDLSADVDFQALADAAIEASEGVEVHGPVEQGAFLLSMGIGELAGRRGAAGANEVERAWRRLVDRGVDGMGSVYKVMAVVPEAGGQRRPVGFGGDVAS